MTWKKISWIFVADKRTHWLTSHASVPFPEHLHDDVFKIYFTPRDECGRSNVCHIIIDLKEPTRILDWSAEPDLKFGRLGCFDDRGAMGSCLVHHEGRRLLYYVGWNTGTTVPWRNAIGLAISEADTPGWYRRYAEGPIIDRSPDDPLFVSNPYVMRDGDRWRMWYISGTAWCEGTGVPRPRYHVAYADSADGVNWTTGGRVAITHAHPGEVAISRPCVIRDADMYRMWYSYRGDTFGYRIGFASSPDGVTWRRRDAEAGLTVSAEGWDCEAVAYPTVFDHKGSRYMLYCGNEYSKTGFGLAVQD